MKRLQDLPLGVKIGALGALGAVAAGFCGATAVIESGKVARSGMNAARLDQINFSVEGADLLHSNAQITLRNAALAATAKDRETAVADQKEIADQISALFGAVTPVLHTTSPDVQTAVLGMQAELTNYMQAAQPVTAELAALAGSPRVGQLLAADAGRVDAVDARTTAAEDLLASRSAQAAAEVDRAQAALRLSMLIATVIGLLVIAVVSWAVTRSITRPVARMVEALKALARRDLTVDLAIHRQDEIGVMASAMTEALTGLRDTMHVLGDSSATLGNSARQLGTVSHTMEASAQDTARQAGQVSSSAALVSHGADSMAAATEQMGASIQDIARNAASAAEVARAAVADVQTTSGAVERLGNASTEIGEIVRSITAIAGQTNLLALNATIEAARAGDAGKGFAVVASEVKDLSQATARATQDITAKIMAIQGTAEETALAMTNIAAVVNRMNDFQTMIAAAVEEQSATTAELTRSVTDVAGNAADIASSISSVADVAASTSSSAKETQQSANELNNLSDHLKKLVAEFKVAKPV